MSLEPQQSPKWMQAFLEEVDHRPFIVHTSAIAGEVSDTGDVVFIYDVLRKAVRCACLLDKFAETDDQNYLTEFVHQRTQFYSLMPHEYHIELERVETEVKEFFKYERELIHRIRYGDTFLWKDIQTYVLGKSGDNLMYGTILEYLAPGWTHDHTEALRTQTILFDIGKDIRDFPDDMATGAPNVLYMALTTIVRPHNIPADLQQAVSIAHDIDVDKQIITFAETFLQQIPPEIILSSPTLETAMGQRMEAIRRALQPF